jgi:SAM-dependent methyltransferase
MGVTSTLFRRAADLVDVQWQVLHDTLHQLAPHARGRLLDVGCADKPYEDLFSPYVTSYVGVEHEATFAATAAAARPNRADYFYDGKRLPFDDASFDTVLSVQVLEHTPTPWLLVREMARVLVPGGVLLLSAPFSFRLHEEPHDYFRYTPHGLNALCNDAGLSIKECHPQGGFWSLVGQKLSTLLAFRVARFGAVAQDLGKAGHEASSSERPRFWTLPVVAPSMVMIALGARMLDRIDGDRRESLGFSIVAERR